MEALQLKITQILGIRVRTTMIFMNGKIQHKKKKTDVYSPIKEFMGLIAFLWKSWHNILEDIEKNFLKCDMERQRNKNTKIILIKNNKWEESVYLISRLIYLQ